MSYDEEEFADCPAGEQAETFHQRIVMGLVAFLAALDERIETCRAVADDERSPDERTFMTLHAKVVDGLERVKNPDLTYDAKFKLATKIQGWLSEMDLMG